MLQGCGDAAPRPLRFGIAARASDDFPLLALGFAALSRLPIAQWTKIKADLMVKVWMFICLGNLL